MLYQSSWSCVTILLCVCVCVLWNQISLVNNFLKLGLNKLKLCFRVRLTDHLYTHYLRYDSAEMKWAGVVVCEGESHLKKKKNTFLNFLAEVSPTTKWGMWIIALWIQTSCWRRMWNGSVTAWWICTPTSARWAVAVSQITHWALCPYTLHSTAHTLAPTHFSIILLHDLSLREHTSALKYYTEYLRMEVWQWGWMCVRAGCDQRDYQLDYYYCYY